MNLLELMCAAEYQPTAAVTTSVPDLYHCAKCALKFTKNIDYPGFLIAGVNPETLTWADAESIINLKCCYVTCGADLQPYQS